MLTRIASLSSTESHREEVVESVLQRREEESPGRFSNRWRTQEHKDNSPQGDHSSTKLGAVLGVVEAGTKGPPGQLPEECRDLDKDKRAQDTSTINHLRSTTIRADSRASRETSALRAKRRYRVHESRRANQVQVSPDQEQAARQPTIQPTAEAKLFFSSLLVSSKDLQQSLDGFLRLSKSYLHYDALALTKVYLASSHLIHVASK